MRARQAAAAGRGSGNKVGLANAEAKRKAPFKNKIDGLEHNELPPNLEKYMKEIMIKEFLWIVVIQL